MAEQGFSMMRALAILAVLSTVLSGVVGFSTHPLAFRKSNVAGGSYRSGVVAGVADAGPSSPSALAVFKKNDDDDLSYIESRDMTREEMQALNQKNEDIMNAELIGMTLFSLVLSIPMLYLVWVGFFSETSEMNL